MTNAVGNPLRGWDSLDHVVTSKYDVLHRRTELRVKLGAGAEVLAEQTIYGETQANPEVSNLRGKVYQVKDGAGVATSIEYDFKGNLLEAHRQLAAAFDTQINWNAPVTLESETFVQQTQYDALNRPTSMKTPDQSVIEPKYNEAGLLERVDASIRGAAFTTFVNDIDYDAKGRRERVAYGDVTNGAGVVTEYEYDEFTFRVKCIRTRRTSDNALLQDLRYFYDAVGNIVEMADLAQSTVMYDGQLAEPVWKYEYDAIYRLVHATGREHAGQNADIQQDAYGFPLVNTPNPNDAQAMRNYAQTYQYDEVGNFIEMIHAAMGGTGSWTRRYRYETVPNDPTDPNYPNRVPKSNRLMGTSLPGDAEGQYSEQDPDHYRHDAHGNMKKMPHLNEIEWDFKDQMQHVNITTGQDVYFTYDASGQRVRKVWVHNGITEERIYLERVEQRLRAFGGLFS